MAVLAHSPRGLPGGTGGMCQAKHVWAVGTAAEVVKVSGAGEGEVRTQ